MEDVCKVIEQALGLKEGSVGINDTKDTIQGWDSLGFLTILSALEEKFGNEVTSIDDLANVKSVKEIIDIFNRESII